MPSVSMVLRTRQLHETRNGVYVVIYYLSYLIRKKGSRLESSYIHFPERKNLRSSIFSLKFFLRFNQHLCIPSNVWTRQTRDKQFSEPMMADIQESLDRGELTAATLSPHDYDWWLKWTSIKKSILCIYMWVQLYVFLLSEGIYHRYMIWYCELWFILTIPY